MRAAPRKAALPFSPWDSRALLCVDRRANHYSAAIRSAAVHYLQKLVQGNKSGAIKGGGTELPMCIARLVLAHAARLKKSAALLFGDLRKAYYSALLELVLGAILTVAEREAVLAGTGADAI